VGRICAGVNKLYNEYTKPGKPSSIFRCIDDLDVARVLFEAAFDWARQRGLDVMVGPKGLSPSTAMAS